MNNQKPEPRLKSDGEMLDFHSMFFTIQGEGPFSGHRAIFVRLAGCNLQCPGCDTEYTEGRRMVSISWLIGEIGLMSWEYVGGKSCLVVITGGEPLRQEIGPFVKALTECGYGVQIESNGVFSPDATLDKILCEEESSAFLVISPKTQRINDRSKELAGAFKYVLDHRSVNPDDGLPIRALEHPAAKGVARPREDAPVYVNPYDAQDVGENTLNLRTAARHCQRHGYILGVQLHKLAGLE